MPQKNKGKGGKHHRKGKKNNQMESELVDAPIKKGNQDYAQITKLLGNCRTYAKLLSTGEERVCIIPGKLRRRCWVAKDNIILVGIREDYSDGKCDLLYKYSDREIRQLVRQEELPDEYEKKDNVNDVDFEFEDEQNSSNEVDKENNEEIDFSDEEVNLMDL